MAVRRHRRRIKTTFTVCVTEELEVEDELETHGQKSRLKALARRGAHGLAVPVRWLVKTLLWLVLARLVDVLPGFRRHS